MDRLIPALGVMAALMGASGVALAAAAAHADGGEMARTAAYFLLLHAAALLGATGCARAFIADARIARALLLVGAGLGIGAIIFSADLASRAFAGARLFPMAAPAGGSLMILGWVALALVFAFATLEGRD
jgi:uncharacterized membrane protein YgdD (TMEM256/DUF423 family)